MNKKIIILGIILSSIFILSGCINSENKDLITNSKKGIDNISKDFLNENVTKENKIKNIIENRAKNIKKIEKFNKVIFSDKLEKCNNEKDAILCKKILVEQEGENIKDIKVCRYLEEKEQDRCEQRIVSRLVSRELNSKYCDLLNDDFKKEECIREYKDVLRMELELDKNIFE